MTRQSGFWTTDDTTPVGHQVASYTDAIASKAWAILASCGGKEGVAPNYLNELACTSPSNYTVRVNTGGAVVDGQWMYNDAAYDLTLDTTPTYRTDRIVLRASWSGFILDLYVLKGTDGSSTPPTLTQTSGTTYELSLYQAAVVTGGAITLTDERTWAIVDVDGSTIEASAGELRVKDAGVTYAKLASGASKFTNRQGGSATIWGTNGTSDYTPTTTKMQGGVALITIGTGGATGTVDVTFPVAFAYAPLIFISPYDLGSSSGWETYSFDKFNIINASTTGMTIKLDITGVTGGSTSFYVAWLAIGPE